MSRRLHPTDQALWDRICQTVTPLQNDPIPPTFHPKQLKQYTRQTNNNTNISGKNTKISEPLQAMPKPDAGIYEGVGKRKIRKLRRQQWQPDVMIDLHACTRQVARSRARTIILATYEKNLRHILIITGKGEGILQREILDLLQESTMQKIILGYDFATKKYGGQGALSVIIRRNRHVT